MGLLQLYCTDPAAGLAVTYGKGDQLLSLRFDGLDGS